MQSSIRSEVLMQQHAARRGGPVPVHHARVRRVVALVLMLAACNAATDPSVDGGVDEVDAGVDPFRDLFGEPCTQMHPFPDLTECHGYRDDGVSFGVCFGEPAGVCRPRCWPTWDECRRRGGRLAWTQRDACVCVP